MLYVPSFFFKSPLAPPPSPVFSLFFSVEPSRNTSAPLDRGGSITFSARGNEMKRNETKRDAYSVNRGGKAPVKKRKTRDESRGNYRRSAESVRDIRLRARRTTLVFLSLFRERGRRVAISRRRYPEATSRRWRRRRAVATLGRPGRDACLACRFYFSHERDVRSNRTSPHAPAP